MAERMNMVGGTTKEVRAAFYSENGWPYDLTSATVNFTLTDYTNLHSEPVVRKTASHLGVTDNNIASVVLNPSDTVNLSGRFRYRFSVIDEGGSIDAIIGDLDIATCTDKESVTT